MDSGQFVPGPKAVKLDWGQALVLGAQEDEEDEEEEEEERPEKRQKIEEKEEEDEDEDDFWGQEYKRKQEKKLNAIGLAQPPFRKKKELSARVLQGQAKDIVIDLFYSHTRNKINEEKRIAAAEGSKRQIKAYRQQRKEANAPWFIHDALKIDANERLIKDHMHIPERDFSLIDYFSSVILRSWEIVNESPWGQENQGKIKFIQHCLGVLYSMRIGYKPHDVIYIPRHEYMAFLPLVNDLKSFDYPKNGVKSGMKVITSAYESARKAGWSDCQLRMENREMNRDHGKVSKMYG